MTLKQIEEKADLFLCQDNKMLDKYMDDILGDLKLTSKQAYGLLGLCKICYSMGMVEMQKIKDKEQDERIAEFETQIEKMKCCENCAYWYKLPNGQRDCAETCEKRDNWSLRR